MTYRFLDVIFTFSSVAFPYLAANRNCSRQIARKAGISPTCENIGTLSIFSEHGWGLALATHAQ